MKLSIFAKEQGVSYKTAWRWWKAGVIVGKQMPSGTVIIENHNQVKDEFNNQLISKIISTGI